MTTALAKFIVYALLAIVLLLALGGCATTSGPDAALVPVPLPCPAALDAPEAPPRTLALDASRPGAAVQQYAANRTRWIGYADALSEKLNACK